MITRIEIDGFKSFHNFAFNFRPFQVFIGPNGVGKTNLFEAIVLLANFANEETFEAAARQSRGELVELFTAHPHRPYAHKITFGVGMVSGQSTREPAAKTDKAST